MGGKKDDKKSAAKKGGGKGTAEPKKDKPEPKSAKDEKKGGKTNVKGGKEKVNDDKNKGKNVKSGKKEIASDSEAASDAELQQGEKSEESEEDAGRKKEKRKGQTTSKGATKARTKNDKGKAKKVESEEEDEEESDDEDNSHASQHKKRDLLKGTSQVVMGLTADGKKRKVQKKENARAHLKGATKAMAGLAKKPPEPTKSKRNLKSASRLFMKFRGLKPKSSRKGHFKTASKLFMGLKNKLVAPSLLVKKKKTAAVLKNTSKLMMGLRKSKKKKAEATTGGADKKSAFMLIRLGGKKGANRLLGGLFGRKKAKDKFKPKAQLLSKVSSATSWLIRKFLWRQTKHPVDELSTHEAWLSRMGAKKLPFPSEGEILRHRANMKRFPGAHRFYEEDEDEYGHQYSRTDRHQCRSSQRYHQPSMYEESKAPQEYYNYYQDEEDYYGYQSLNEEEGHPDLQYSYSNRYDTYGRGISGYDDDLEYQVGEDCGHYEDTIDYYEEDSYPAQSQYGYYDYDVETYSPYENGDETDYDDDETKPFGYSQYVQCGSFDGQYNKGIEDKECYENYTQHEVNYSDYEGAPYFQSSYNPYAYPMDDIMEADETEQADEQYGNYSFMSQNFEQQKIEEKLPSTVCLNRKYRLFPRPQVKLFGREKLNVPLPPSPHISFTDFDEDEDEDEFEDQPPFQQFANHQQKSSKSSFSKPFHGNFGHTLNVRLQKPKIQNLMGRRFNPGYEKEDFQDRSSQNFSPREFGSPLGQFMKMSLAPKPILKHHGDERNRKPKSPSPARRPLSQFGEHRSSTLSSPQSSIRQVPFPNNSYQSPVSSPQLRQKFGSQRRKSYYHSSPQPSVRRYEVPQEEFDNQPVEPAYKRYGHKLTGMDPFETPNMTTFRQSDNSSSNNNFSHMHPSPQPSRRSISPSPQPSLRRVGSINSKQLPMPPFHNLPERQRPFSPQSNSKVFGFNNTPSDSYSRFEQPSLASPRSSFRQWSPSSSPQPSFKSVVSPTAKGNIRSSPALWEQKVPFPETPQPNKHNMMLSKRSVSPANDHLTFQSTYPQSVHRKNPPPSPQSSIRRANSFRNEPSTRPKSPQPSIKSKMSKFEMFSSDSINAPSSPSPAHAAPTMFDDFINRELKYPPSPQLSMRQFKTPMSSYFAAKHVGGQESPLSQGSRRINHSLNETYEKIPHAWSRNSEPPTEAVKPLISSSCQPSIKQTVFHGGEPRSLSPKLGPKYFKSGSPCPVDRGPPGSLKGKVNISPHFQRAPLRVSESMTESNPYIPRYPSAKDIRQGAPKILFDQYEPDDGTGRYAVVMPQVQRMGSFQGPSHITKQQWSGQHTVNIQEMHGSWSSAKLLHIPPPESFARESPRRQDAITSYLSHGRRRTDNDLEEGIDKIQPWHNKMHSVRNLPSMRHQEEAEEDGVEDMTQLEDLQEESILNNLKSRFDREIIYTYIGSILVSVNPYKMHNIYGTEYVMKYEGRALGENPPHLFAIANVAYNKMMDAKHNQCIIISGESGSGKTEATKLVLRYLAAVNQKRNVTQQVRILEATPLLESFGNAKTVRNDNSSRFGKFVEIFMEEGVICGAITSQYLLEKSRIVFQAKNERNYHVFYEMLAGLPSQQKQLFCLQDAETYFYLNQGGNCDIPGKSDTEDFQRLLSAMEILNFNAEDQSSIFRILSSVLHLGNIYFEKYETDSQEVASVVSAREIRMVSELLQISPEGLQKAITYKVTETMREKIFTPLSVESAVDARDAIAKILYSLLFRWLTDRINKLVYPKQDSFSIAILDIYGFEDLSFNSFEQLCINYANECLQSFFNKIVFKEEQEEYIREQIDWREITFNDNQPCIDIISQKPHGILRILDDQSCFPQATDHTFLQKCHYHHGSNALYSKPKMPLPEFTIKHYAGKVTYQVHKFLDKNHDQVRQEVLDLFVNSKTKVVANLFFSHAQQLAQQKTMMGKNSTVTRRYKPPTVAAKFQHSLLELVEKMERCNPFFVRCIKPNNKKEPRLFESDVVTSQLKYSGILETIRIRKEGYPIRIPFQIFLDRYRCVLRLNYSIPADGENCITVLKKLCTVTQASYCVGVNKLFMKEHVYQVMESKRDRVLHLAAVSLQRIARGFLVRRRYLSLQRKIILLQARARGCLARQKYRNLRMSLMKFRSLVHMYINRRRYLKMKAEVRRIIEEERRIAEEERQRIEMELTKREVIRVTHLEIPAELSGLLEAVTVEKHINEECVAIVQAPQLQEESQLTLPLDINNYTMSKYVRLHFKEPSFGMLTVPLGSALTQVEEELRHDTTDIFKLVLRFMGDPHLNGAQENLLGNYIIQKGLSHVGLRDEILAQVANQVWRNTNPNNEERGWLLLASCLSGFAPSLNMDKHLLKYVSDYAYDGYKAVCQHKLMQAMKKTQQGPETARTYPPSLLEWTANRERANMALDVHCFDGLQLSSSIHSWMVGEELATDVLRHRGITDSWNGWSIAMKEKSQWAELAGHDYILDLISDLELPRNFPKQKSYFIIASESMDQRHGSLALKNGSEAHDEIPPPPVTKAPSLLPANTPHSDGYYSHGDSDSFSEPPTQKGLDRYLDSLFDPVLSYGNGDLEKPSAVLQRMKGGGKVGGRDGAEEQTDGSTSAETLQQAATPAFSPLAKDLIRHTKMNSEHFPEPTHRIKDIIRQYQHPLGIKQADPRRDAGRIFTKKLDPHEEAMKILKGKMAARATSVQVPTSVSTRPPVPKETIAMVRPVPSTKIKKVSPPVSAEPGRSAAAPSGKATVSRELAPEQEQIQTQLHRQSSMTYYSYCNVPWKIYIRKEVFYPKDSLNNPLVLDLIYKQVLHDTLSEACIRVTREERLKMKSLLVENGLDSPNAAAATETAKRKVVSAAKEDWEVYFSRLFPAAGSVGTGIQILGVSHTGIKLLKLVRSSDASPEQLRVLQSYSYSDILFVTIPSENMLEFNLNSEKLILFSCKAPQAKAIIDYFLTELKKDSNYVVAVKSHISEDWSLLNFHKGDIIHLQSMEGLEKDQNYGCIVRKKVLYLEELRPGTQDFGWKFGAIHGKSGIFPSEYVQPVAAPDFIRLPEDKKEEPQNKQGKVAVSAAVAVAVASTAVAQELDRKMDVSPAPSDYGEGVGDYMTEVVDDSVLQDTQYTMLEFAKKYFQNAQKKTTDSFKQRSKKEQESTDPAEMLKFAKSPIQESLIEFRDQNMSRRAVDIFQAVMKFMGDYPLKGQTELDVVCSILKLCRDNEVLKDECYCQIIKQITDNTSSKSDSCQRGWRLLYILTAYYRCSEVLKPYLFKFLQDTCRSPGLHFQGIAKACEQNLRKTLQFGGRCEYPSGMELKAMVAGRSSKRQLFLLPGGLERHLKIKTCSVAFDVLEEICFEMALHTIEAFDEYALLALTNRGQNVRPLNKREYILDVSTQMEQVDSSYMFWFRRVIWVQPLKFENELYVTMHYNQVLPDYLKGLFNTMPQMKLTEQQFQQTSRLAALQHRAKDSIYLPTLREVQDYVPGQFYKLLKPQSWLNMVLQQMQQIQTLSGHQARVQFLGLLNAVPMFGSSFFYIQSCSNNSVPSPCILAVNQNGLHFLHKETHELIVRFPLKEIQATRTQRPTAGSSYPYVVIMLGDLMSQRITQLQLEQGLELCRVIATHMENLLHMREKQLTLPPSEITLL
ncbi:unconventional myosin-XV [Microcaecilia unicolor]|uniref:Unconventional myosin-XV n=1 Tax=Microcaecilia unicolor TaxID=1415580 RepID=A0A6P7YK83_9AMPH|nr:unconventional myosin-XV [Microcaecilia unicolor]